MKRTFFLLAALVFLTIQNHAQTVTDIDGNVYNTVTIGTQVWMQENLRTIHFNNGESIPFVAHNDWSLLTTPAFCNYFNDTNNVSTYGRLYNSYTVSDSRNMCPTGWHVPSDSEWTVLVDFLGGDSIAGGKMKEADTTHWLNPNIGASNSSGFTALPGGYLNIMNEMFLNKRFCGYFWSSTGCDTCGFWIRELEYATSSIFREKMYFSNGLSVRCINDFSANINNFNSKDNILIFPNPANDKVIIDCSEKLDMKMQVYNMIGELMLQKELDKNKNEIDISALSTGLYIIKVSCADWTVQKKLIKE